jgi:hypothetical protein
MVRTSLMLLPTLDFHKKAGPLLVADGRSVAICHYENDSSRGWGSATAPEASAAKDST